MNQDQIKALVAEQLGKIGDRRRREALERILVEPAEVIRGWGYSEARFETWTVGRDAGERVELLYAIGAFGDPWGFVPLGSDDLGMDGQWFLSLDDAFISCSWDGPLPPGYEVQ